MATAAPVGQLVDEALRLERRLARAVLEILEALLEGRLSRREAARLFLELYTKAALPDPLEDILSTLILVDEEPQHGAPTRQELEQLLSTLKKLAQQPPSQSTQPTDSRDGA